MWLASFARWRPDRKVHPTTEWGRRDFELAEKELHDVLEGVGDPGIERMFRMVVTACMQRGLSDAEISALPPSCRMKPEHLAGGSVEILYHHGPPQPLSAMPCVNVGREDLRDYRAAAPYRDSRIWIPKDCGDCDPCRARAAIEAGEEA